MFCEQCGKQLRDGARFCSSCGADLRGSLPAEEPAGDPRPQPRQVQAPQPSAPRPVRAPAPKKKKSKAPLIIALVLLLALLAGGGWLLYQKVIFPKTVLKDAELLVHYLETSPQRDKWDDFELRADFAGHHYSHIVSYPEARLKIKDYLRGLYQRGDYGAWVHSMGMLQDCCLFFSGDETAYVIDRADVEDLYNQGWAVNLNGGWYSDSGNQRAVYSEYPGFTSTENFEVFVWGDFFAAHSFEYSWHLFYRGYELDEIEPARWSSTSASQLQYILQNARVCGNLLIVPYDAGLVYDAYLVHDIGTGESFQVFYG